MGERSLDELVAELKRVDPESAKVVDLKNPRRVLRALEVVHVTGRSFVEQQKKGEPLVDAFLMGIAHSSEELRKRIDENVDMLFSRGWIDEVKRLHEGGVSFDAPAMTALGYREIGAVLRSEMSEKEAREKIKLATWHYAKRQMTWFKKEERVHWVKNEEEASGLATSFTNDVTERIVGLQEL
jgi:tRNA dimethylallyltransferase